MMKGREESVAGLDSVERFFPWREDLTGCFDVFEVVGNQVSGVPDGIKIVL